MNIKDIIKKIRYYGYKGILFKKLYEIFYLKVNFIVTVWYEKFKLLICFSYKNYNAVIMNAPDYGNLGDQAILISEKIWLKKECGYSQILEISGEVLDSKVSKIVFKKIKAADLPIFYMGGGNIGSLWPVFEKRFQYVLQEFEHQQIIVFPQTVFFDDESKNNGYMDKAYRIYCGHEKLLICLREKKSFDFMERYMPAINKLLLPDMVLLLRKKGNCRRKGILLCFRKDIEGVLHDNYEDEIYVVLRQYYKGEKIKITDTVVPGMLIGKQKAVEVNKKLIEFSTAKLVVTDRLHGMLFALITSTPCIAFDNVSGKVSGVYEDVKKFPYIRMVKDIGGLKKEINNLDLSKHYQYNNCRMYKEMYKLKKIILESKN